MTLYLGTSGWQYKHWRETFYPKTVPQKTWLEFYAERFQTVELNNSFYRLPPPQNFEAWRERTPDDFVIAVKASRYLTHIKRLKEPQQPVQVFLENAKPLKEKFGPVLVQLPPNLKIDLPSLDETLSEFTRIRPDVRVAVEFRHASWWTDETRALLERHGAALCMADRNSRPISPIWRTADWTFLRFHEGTARPWPCYGRSSLETWAKRLASEWRSGADVFVYFNNDPRACALRDARVFAGAAQRAGLHPTRIPAAADVTLG